MIVFFDLETGGLKPKVHPLIQFAAVAVDSGWKEADSLEVKIHFHQREAVSPDAARFKIAAFFREHAVLEKTSKAGNPYKVARGAGHNAVRFDGPFLKAFFGRAAVPRDRFVPVAIYELLDTLQLARWAAHLDPLAPASLRLESCCEWLGVELQNAHDALADVRATAAIAPLLLRKLGWSP